MSLLGVAAINDAAKQNGVIPSGQPAFFGTDQMGEHLFENWHGIRAPVPVDSVETISNAALRELPRDLVLIFLQYVYAEVVCVHQTACNVRLVPQAQLSILVLPRCRRGS
jgi:hypothetical protein